MNAVISVVGIDKVGITAFVTKTCEKYNANIVDISQKVLDNYFTMIMIVSIDKLNVNFIKFVEEFELLGKNKDLVIRVMHEDIFNAMHKI